MDEQKFCCKGVRTTGQRASVMVSASNKEAAIQIANKHGLLVDSAIPVAEPAPQPPKVVNKKLDDRLDDILSAEDEELAGGSDDFDLDDDLGPAPTSPGSPSTKACPYCGEQILAVAVKCKHCASYVGQKAAKTRQPSDDAPSPGVPKRVWAIVGGVVGACVVVIIIVVAVVLSRPSTPPVSPPPPEAAVTPAPPAPETPPKPPIYKPSSEEMAFAAKLTAFLDSCDELARLLEKVPKMDQYNKQCEAIKARSREVPPPPQGSSWAGEAAASSKTFLDTTLGVLTYEVTTLDAAMEALHQSAGDSPEIREAYRKVADEVRKPAAAMRSQIPPACLAKPK